MRQLLLIAMLLFAFAPASYAQQMNKKYKTFVVSRELPFSADKVWKAVADDYGNIANSHPTIVASNYEKGSLQGEMGAKRVCYFNDKGTQVLHEEIVAWNPEQGYFVNRILTAQKFPVDPENTRATYTIKALGANRSEISMKMEFRTKPAFMAAMAKGQFKRLLNDYFIAVEHNISTGESVTVVNFKDIKKQYK